MSESKCEEEFGSEEVHILQMRGASNCTDLANARLLDDSMNANPPPFTLSGPTLNRIIYKELQDGDVVADDMKAFVEKDLEFTRAQSRLKYDDPLTERTNHPDFKIRFASKYPVMTKPGGNGGQKEEIDQIIIVDRSVDFISPCITPFTYEALLDLAFHIQGPTVAIPEGICEVRKIRLAPPDSVYQMTRDLPSCDLGPILHNCALELQSSQKGLPQDKSKWTKTVENMQTVVHKVKEQQALQQSLSGHIEIIGYLLNQLLKNVSFRVLLRIEDHILSGGSSASGSSFDETCDLLVALCRRKCPVYDIMRLTILLARVHNIQPDNSKLKKIKIALFKTHGIFFPFYWSLFQSLGYFPQYEHCASHFPKQNNGRSGQTYGSWESLYKLYGSAPSREQVSTVHSGYAPFSGMSRK